MAADEGAGPLGRVLSWRKSLRTRSSRAATSSPRTPSWGRVSWKINSFDGNADYFGLEIVGEKRSAGAHDTTIFADFIDAPALMIHCGYGTTIKNIAIVGQNRVDLELARNLEKYTSLDPAQATMRGLSEMFSDDKNFLQNWTRTGQAQRRPTR